MGGRPKEAKQNVRELGIRLVCRGRVVDSTL